MKKKDIISDYVSENKSAYPKGLDIIKSGETQYKPSIIEKILVDWVESLQSDNKSMNDKLDECKDENIQLKVKNAELMQNQRNSIFSESMNKFSGIILGCSITTVIAALFSTPYNLILLSGGFIGTIIFSAIFVMSLKESGVK
jgi:hypothetical protein